MPVFQYFFGVGGILLCLLFVTDVLIPKLPPRPGHDLDKSTIRITAEKPSGDFVLNTFPPIAPDPSAAPSVTAEPSTRAAFAKLETEAKPKRPARRKTIAARSVPQRFARNDGFYPDQQAWSRQAWASGPTRSGGWSSSPWSSNSWPSNPWRSNSWSNGW